MTNDNSNLDFLRALAVLYVVIFHLLLQSQHFSLGGLNFHTLGTWGVLIFFVHTSLVLMFSLCRMPGGESPPQQYAAFVVRRLFRLLPLSVACVLLIYWLRLPLDYSDRHFHAATFSHSELISNLLLVQDITHAESIESPLWTLPYEMQMYLCLPFLFWLARARGGFWRILLVFSLAMLVPGVLSLSVRLQRSLPDFPWDLLNYVPCFVAGVLAFALWRTAPRLLPSVLWPPFVIALTVGFLLSGHLGNRWISPAWVLCLGLGIGLTLFRPLTSSYVTLPSKLIARYSYGIYLTHFFCIWLAFVRLSYEPAALRWLVFAVLAVALPVLFYHALEEPMIKLGGRLAARLLVRQPMAAQASSAA